MPTGISCRCQYCVIISHPWVNLSLAELIGDNRIQARIDSANKVVYARNSDQRNATFQKSMNMGTAYVRNVKSMLMRMSLIKHDFVVRHPKGKDKGGGGRRGDEKTGGKGQ